MLNITHYQRNANQNYNEMPPYTSQNGHHQNVYKKSIQKGCGEKRTLLHCGNVLINLYSHYGEQDGGP